MKLVDDEWKDFDYTDLLAMQGSVTHANSNYRDWILWRDRLQATRNNISIRLNDRALSFLQDYALMEIYRRIILVGDGKDERTDGRLAEAAIIKMNALFEAAKLIRATQEDSYIPFKDLEDSIRILKKFEMDSSMVKELRDGPEKEAMFGDSAVSLRNFEIGNSLKRGIGGGSMKEIRNLCNYARDIIQGKTLNTNACELLSPFVVPQSAGHERARTAAN